MPTSNLQLTKSHFPNERFKHNLQDPTANAPETRPRLQGNFIAKISSFSTFASEPSCPRWIWHTRMKGLKYGTLIFPMRKQNTIIHLAKLLYFTNLGFPEIRGIPFLTYLLGWGHEKCVSFISPINLIFAEENWRFGILPKPKLQKEVFKLLKQPAWVVQEPS